VISCPLCHSKRIHHSQRQGILEQVILAMILIRPYRCEKCDHRFFRRSINTNHNSSRQATTS